MKRSISLVLIGVGVTLFGIATGLVYIDGRRERRELLKLTLADQHEGQPARKHDADDLADGSTPPILLAAMAIGPLGAGMTLAGGAGVLFAWSDALRSRRTLPTAHAHAQD